MVNDIIALLRLFESHAVDRETHGWVIALATDRSRWSEAYRVFDHISHVLATRRLRAAAKRLPCPTCGAPLGLGAVTLADSTWRAYVAELRKLSPRVRLRLVRLYHAICPACGQQLKFRESTKSFLPLASPQVLTFLTANETSGQVGA